VHRPGYSTPAQITSELTWSAALREEAGILTPAAIPARDGSQVTVVSTPQAPEARPCVMFDFCPGSEPAEDDELASSFERLGSVAARIHRHAQAWTPPPAFVRRTWDFATTIGDRPHWGRWEDGVGVGLEEVRLLARLREKVQSELTAYGTSAECFGLVHADMRLANLLVDGADTYVIDFDDCGRSWFLYDLATALTLIEDRPDVAQLIESWLHGYRRVRPLTGADIQIIPTLMMLRCLLVVAWIGSHARTELAQEQGVAYTRMTCDLAERYLGGSLPWK
jgi:Ser/Thr protein kinase RdoA (MazF antagonist)